MDVYRQADTPKPTSIPRLYRQVSDKIAALSAKPQMLIMSPGMWDLIKESLEAECTMVPCDLSDPRRGAREFCGLPVKLMSGGSPDDHWIFGIFPESCPSLNRIVYVDRLVLDKDNPNLCAKPEGLVGTLDKVSGKSWFPDKVSGKSCEPEMEPDHLDAFRDSMRLAVAGACAKRDPIVGPLVMPVQIWDAINADAEARGMVVAFNLARPDATAALSLDGISVELVHHKAPMGDGVYVRLSGGSYVPVMHPDSIDQSLFTGED